MILTIDTAVPVSDLDRLLLQAFLGGAPDIVRPVAEHAVPEGDAPKPKKRAPKPRVEAKPAPAPEPEPEEADDEPEASGKPDLMAQARARAVELMDAGRKDVVREALSQLGARRLAEMPAKDLPAFLALLED